MENCKSKKYRFCFVRGCAIDELRSSIRYYQIPKESAPNYLGTIEAIGHTRECIEGAKPKSKYICSKHYTEAVNQCARISDNIYPTLNLHQANSNYYSKERCVCAPSFAAPPSKDLDRNDELLFQNDNYVGNQIQANQELQNNKIISLPAKIDSLRKTIDDLQLEALNNKQTIKNLEEELTRNNTLLANATESSCLEKLIDNANASENEKTFSKIILSGRSSSQQFTVKERELCHNLFLKSPAVYQYMRDELNFHNLPSLNM